MLIGEFCARSGLTKDTVRHYEALGLLEPRRLGAGRRQYRHYAEDSLERVELIRIGAQSGMTLREMQPTLNELMAGKVSFEGQRDIVRTQIARLEARMVDLNAAKARLNALIGEIDERERIQGANPAD